MKFTLLLLLLVLIGIVDGQYHSDDDVTIATPDGDEEATTLESGITDTSAELTSPSDSVVTPPDGTGSTSREVSTEGSGNEGEETTSGGNDYSDDYDYYNYDDYDWDDDDFSEEDYNPSESYYDEESSEEGSDEDYDIYAEDGTEVLDKMEKASANLTSKNKECDRILLRNVHRAASQKETLPKVPTKVSVKVILIALNDISDLTGHVSLVARMDFKWIDRRLALKKNRKSSCKRQSVLLPTDEIWFPYFQILNGADVLFHPEAFESFPSLVTSSGIVSWRVALNLLLSCELDVNLFPFDRQLCPISLESPHYTSSELFYTSTNDSRAVILLSKDVGHVVWNIAGQNVTIHQEPPGAKFYIEFHRKATFYVYTIFIPLISIFVQTASTFILPANNGEKMSVAIAGLLSYFFLFLLFVSTTPTTSTDIPALLIFFAIQIVLTVIVVLVSGIIRRLAVLEDDAEYQPENPKIPRAYRSILNRISLRKLDTIQWQVAERLTKGKLHSEMLNDICLFVYLGAVLISGIVLAIRLSANYESSTSHYETTTMPIKDFRPKLDL